MKLTATFSADGSEVLKAGDVTDGRAAFATDAELLASADTSVAVTVADEHGTFFSASSADFTTAGKYKYTDAAFLRNGTTGKYTATITGLDSGTFTVTIWKNPHA